MSPELSRVVEKIKRADLPPFAEVALDSANARGGAYGETMLHVVAVWGEADSARVLLDEGADIDVPGEHGCTPLHEAALQGHIDVVTLLLSRGADPSLRSEFGDFFEIAARGDSDALRHLAAEARNCEPRAAPNGGPAAHLGNSGVTEGASIGELIGSAKK